MGSSTFTWKVELPEKKQASLGGSKPRAQLIIDSHKGHEELYIPLALGKLLIRFSDSDASQPTSRAELLFLVKEKAYECAMARISRLIDKRDYSTKEVQTKLKLDGYSQEVIERALGRACEVHLIDEKRFADIFIRSKLASGWGVTRISQELARKGIDSSSIASWPDAYLDTAQEADRAFSLIEHRRIPERNAFQKLMRYLIGRGFSYSDAQKAVSRRLED